MRAPKRRASSPSSGREGLAEDHGDRRPAEPSAPRILGARAAGRAVAAARLGQDVAGAVQVDRHHRPAGAPGQVGGAAPEGLGPAVGGAAALGEDDQVPAVGQEPGRGVGRAAVDLGCVRWGWRPGRTTRAPPSTSGRRSSRRRRPPPCGGGTRPGGWSGAAGVSTWLAWLAAKITGRSARRRCSSPRTVVGATSRAAGRVRLSSTTARASRTG